MEQRPLHVNPAPHAIAEQVDGPSCTAPETSSSRVALGSTPYAVSRIRIGGCCANLPMRLSTSSAVTEAESHFATGSGIDGLLLVSRQTWGLTLQNDLARPMVGNTMALDNGGAASIVPPKPIGQDLWQAASAFIGGV